MHELSLMADLFRKIERVAREQGARRVTGVTVRLGALSHVSAEHLREHFSAMSQGTVAEGAQLSIESCSGPDEPGAQDVVLESIEVEVPVP
ncbi:MAG: hydrogenase maturation nickel metallochaperone HypA [Myxococcales bacterium]|nr:hydrogenase maturation nickel metallochaperone HypA [Myxococcota bacterium]MDW8283697.1 hydrogenase maturation nickel metallochaperone HypA [Myxococcales bacterium]